METSMDIPLKSPVFTVGFKWNETSPIVSLLFWLNGHHNIIDAILFGC